MRRLLAVFLFLPLAAVAQDKKGTQYAFLVGCSGYAESQLKPLPYAVNDIEQFRLALLETGFEADRIKTLTDKQAARFLPEQRKIQKELGTLLAGLNPDDTVVVALSGHGVHFKNDPTGYFCPLDADLKDKATLIPFEGKGGLFDTLKACKAKRKLLIVNACRNDPASDRAQAAEKIDLDDAAPEVVPEGIAAIYSCREGQKSYFDPKRQQGIFFDHVTKAWRGEYAPDRKHSTIEDFFREVGLRTKLDADKTYGEAQVPEVKREYKEEWPVPASQFAAENKDYAAARKSPDNGDGWLKAIAPGRSKEWRRLAEGGIAAAMMLTGRCLDAGAGAEKDQERAADWFRKAAALGDVEAMNRLAVFYINGAAGVEKDKTRGADWFRKAAALGDGRAMNNLGYCYHTGTGVEKDVNVAVSWYEKAAARGDALGMFSLGVCYEDGTGVEKDAAQALAWYRKAAALGDKAAQKVLKDSGQE